MPRKRPEPILSSIDDEATTLPEMVAKLRAAGVEVVDVRAVAASRGVEFSKSVLRNLLAAEGIGYEHLRGLGTHKPQVWPVTTLAHYAWS